MPAISRNPIPYGPEESSASRPASRTHTIKSSDHPTAELERRGDGGRPHDRSAARRYRGCSSRRRCTGVPRPYDPPIGGPFANFLFLGALPVVDVVVDVPPKEFKTFPPPPCPEKPGLARARARAGATTDVDFNVKGLTSKAFKGVTTFEAKALANDRRFGRTRREEEEDLKPLEGKDLTAEGRRARTRTRARAHTRAREAGSGEGMG